MELWSPGTADLLDYDESICRFVDPELSGNATTCRMNLDHSTAPNRRLSLIAGTDSAKLLDLFDNFAAVFDEVRFRKVVEKIQGFILDPEFKGWDVNPINELLSEGFVTTGCLESDATVCVWSAHARSSPLPGSATVPALANKVAKTPSRRVFKHTTAGDLDHPIRPYADEDIIAILSDHFVAQPLEEHYVAPSNAPGEVRFRTNVEYNARQGDITSIVAVVYGRYEARPGEYAWKILAGADDNGEPSPGAVIAIDPQRRNSVGGEADELEAFSNLPPVDPMDPSTDIDLVKYQVISLGPSWPTVPPEPPEGGFNLPDPQP